MRSPEELAKIAAEQKELWKELMDNYQKEEVNQQPKSAVQPSFDAEYALFEIFSDLLKQKEISLTRLLSCSSIAYTEPFNVWLSSYRDSYQSKQDQLKQQALNKLSDDEKKALGLL